LAYFKGCQSLTNMQRIDPAPPYCGKMLVYLISEVKANVSQNTSITAKKLHMGMIFKYLHQSCNRNRSCFQM